MKMTSIYRQKVVSIKYEQACHPFASAQLGEEEKLYVNFREALDLITNELVNE